jgi:Mg2+ and Co2+ transporter CorA
MSSENTINGITWIDLTNPSINTIKSVLSRYELTIPTETILDFSKLPKLHIESTVYHFVLRFPRLYKDTTREHRTSFQIDFIIANNLLISIHEISLFEITNTLLNQQKQNSPLNLPTSSLSLFGIIVTEFYSTIRKQLEDISEQLEQIELELFKQFEHKLLEKISKVSKHLIDIERTINASGPVIHQLIDLNKKTESKNIDLATELYFEIRSLLETNTLIMRELRNTHQSMTAHNTTTAVRNLSIITFLTLPISVVVDMIKIRYTPEVAHISWSILIAIGVVTLLLVVYFRYRRLL